MYPEKSILTQKIRRTIMGFWIVLFFILAPAVLMYTAGYGYDWQNKRLTRTGVISIDIQPDDATVEVNGIMMVNRMPLRLANRRPGSYRIKIYKEGYYSWERDVALSSGETTYIRNVTLLKKNLPAKIFDEEKSLSKIYSREDGQKAILSYQDNVSNEIFIFDTNNERKNSIKKVNTATSTTMFDWSPKNKNLLIATKTLNSLNLDVYNSDEEILIQRYNFTYSGVTPTVKFSKGNGEKFIMENNVGLYLLENNSSSPIVGIQTDTYWYEDESGDVWIIDNNSSTITSIYKRPTTTLPYPYGYYIKEILDINKNRIIAKNDNKIVIINQNYPEDIRQIEANGIKKNIYNKDFIAWSGSEVWSIKEDGYAELVHRANSKIKDVYLLDEHGVILLVSDNSLRALNTNYFLSENIFENGKIEEVFVNQKERKIFFLGTVGTRYDFYKIEY